MILKIIKNILYSYELFFITILSKIIIIIYFLNISNYDIKLLALSYHVKGLNI